jgi:hypothetical protein
VIRTARWHIGASRPMTPSKFASTMADAISAGAEIDHRFNSRHPDVRFALDSVAKLSLMRIANRDSVGGYGIGGSGA